MKKYVNAAQAAEIVGKSEKTIRRWIEGGLLPATKQNERLYAIDLEDLERVTESLRLGKRELEIRLVQAELQLRKLEERLSAVERHLLEQERRQALPPTRPDIAPEWEKTSFPFSSEEESSLSPGVDTMTGQMTGEQPQDSSQDAQDWTSRPDRRPERARHLPPGSLLMAEYARSRDWSRRTISDYIAAGQVEATSVDKGGRPEYWLTPEQQAELDAFMRAKEEEKRARRERR